MQTLMQVHCGKGRSLRAKIASDKQLEQFGLHVREQKRMGRSHGWSKLYGSGEGRFGAVNLAWRARTSILECRVVNKRQGKPNAVLGDLVDYLLSRHAARIRLITITRT